MGKEGKKKGERNGEDMAKMKWKRNRGKVGK